MDRFPAFGLKCSLGLNLLAKRTPQASLMATEQYVYQRFGSTSSALDYSPTPGETTNGSRHCSGQMTETLLGPKDLRLTHTHIVYA